MDLASHYKATNLATMTDTVAEPKSPHRSDPSQWMDCSQHTHTNSTHPRTQSDLWSKTPTGCNFRRCRFVWDGMQLVKRKGMHRKCIYDLPRARRRWWGCRRCDFFGAASILLLYARTKRLEYVVTYPDRRTFFTGGVPLSGPTRQLKRLLMETQRLASILAPRQPPDNGAPTGR